MIARLVHHAEVVSSPVKERCRGWRVVAPVNRSVWPDKRRRKFAAVDEDIRAAVEASHLRGLPSDALDELMVGSVRRRISAGSVTHREAGSAPYLELLMSGLVRAFVTAPDGRALTVRYCHPGALIGVYTLFARPLATSGSTQALVESELVQMSPAVARRLAGTDVPIARVLLTELSERVQSFIAEISGGAFTTVRQRVARHLLDLASPGMSAHGELQVLVSQRELADAVGTVREVVVRVLREFRAEELIRTERDRIVMSTPSSSAANKGETKVPDARPWRSYPANHDDDDTGAFQLEPSAVEGLRRDFYG